MLLLLGGCRTEEAAPRKSQEPPVTQPVTTTPKTPGCIGCHSEVKLDPVHALPCISCHGGLDNEGQIDKAHVGLIAKPAHPENMDSACGTCHPRQTTDAAHSLHFTLIKKINAIRAHFGAQDLLTTPTEIAVATSPATPLTLADDMLRRRCLRCHVYSSGDDYSAVTHGTGCSACHLPYKAGKLQSHAFIAPTDNQCLSCHYANYVGSDYYGRYEHDFNWEYRTPFTIGKTPFRSYGVETHDLAADIHQQRGLACIDCHQDSGHNQTTSLACDSCHDWQPGGPTPPLRNLQVRNKMLILTARQSGKEYTVPSMQHPAHLQYRQKVACQVCHGQWSVNDSTTHLLLSKKDTYEPWERLTVQASSAIETLLEHNLSGYKDERPPTMRDGLTGESRQGVWYQGFDQRRWESMIIQKDSDGIIKVFRPVLDLRLSMVEADGQVLFDSIKGSGAGLKPYTPHTTGHAGLFYLDRFKHLLAPDGKPVP
jgi:hypothetical protein